MDTIKERTVNLLSGNGAKHIHLWTASHMLDYVARVWNEFDYRVEVCRASGEGHIEHLWEKKVFLNLVFLYVY